MAVKVCFELLLLVERVPDEFNLKGEATVALDVTLGWAFNKTFEVSDVCDLPYRDE